MSLQNEGFVEKTITIKATKRLVDCIEVAHVAFVVVVPEYLQSFIVFFLTLRSKLSHNVPFRNIYIIQEKLDS